MKNKNYSLISRYDEVTPASKEIRAFCLECNIKTKFCNELEICLVEALNNIIKHAYKEDFTKTIHRDINIDKTMIEIELPDSGIERKKFNKPTLDYDPKDIENLPEGGMGLYIIDQLMDEISYRHVDGVNKFTMKKYLV